MNGHRAAITGAKTTFLVERFRTKDHQPVTYQYTSLSILHCIGKKTEKYMSLGSFARRSNFSFHMVLMIGVAVSGLYINLTTIFIMEFSFISTHTHNIFFSQRVTSCEGQDKYRLLFKYSILCTEFYYLKPFIPTCILTFIHSLIPSVICYTFNKQIYPRLAVHTLPTCCS